MNVDDIISKIRKSLTGDAEKDSAIIVEILTENGLNLDSPEFEEICNELFTNISLEIIENEKTEEKLLANITNVLDHILAYRKYGKIKEAYNLTENLVNTIEKKGLDFDSLKAEEKIFYQPMEELIYDYLKDEVKKYPHLKYPLDTIYFLYGNLLIDKGEYEKAAKTLKKALEYSPMNENFRLELVEAYKYGKDLDKALEESIYILNNGFTPETIAHAYRNVSYIFSEKRLFQEALIALELAKIYETDFSKLINEYEYIRQQNGSLPELPPQEEAEKLLAKYNVPFSPALLPARLALDMAKLSERQGQYESAIYYYDLFNKLEHHDELDEIIIQLIKKAQKQSD